jgi:hypothetical protein
VTLLALSQETASAIVAVAGIGLGFVVLGIVGWIFWRAAKRDREAAKLGQQHPPRDRRKGTS